MGIDFPRYSNQILSFILGSSFRNRGAQIHTKKIVFKISFCDYGRLLTKPSYYSSQKHSQLYITIFLEREEHGNAMETITSWNSCFQPLKSRISAKLQCLFDKTLVKLIVNYCLRSPKNVLPTTSVLGIVSIGARKSSTRFSNNYQLIYLWFDIPYKRIEISTSFPAF